MKQGTLCPRLCAIIRKLDSNTDIAQNLASNMMALSWNLVMEAGTRPVEALRHVTFRAHEAKAAPATVDPCGSLLGSDTMGIGLRSEFGLTLK